jgi:Primase C terminal 2 (PriCT-2)
MRKPRKEENPSTSPSSLPPDGVVAELTEALFELDPCEWGSEGSQESYDGWLALMMACKAAGISKEDWLAWCAGDECYADAGDEIGRKWDGVPARHADALFKALAKGGIRLSREVQKWRSAGVPLLPPAIKPHPNLKPRTDGLLRWLRRNATADNLFNAACLLAELGVTSATATRLISGNLPSLRKALGDAEFTYQITRAYTHIAAKGAAAPTERIT